MCTWQHRLCPGLPLPLCVQRGSAPADQMGRLWDGGWTRRILWCGTARFRFAASAIYLVLFIQPALARSIRHSRYHAKLPGDAGYSAVDRLLDPALSLVGYRFVNQPDISLWNADRLPGSSFRWYYFCLPAVFEHFHRAKF